MQGSEHISFCVIAEFPMRRGRNRTQHQLIFASFTRVELCHRIAFNRRRNRGGSANPNEGVSMKNKRILPIAASVFVLALSVLPNAVAQCGGLRSSLVHPSN
jgi:hypothetical protein